MISFYGSHSGLCLYSVKVSIAICIPSLKVGLFGKFYFRNKTPIFFVISPTKVFITVSPFK